MNFFDTARNYTVSEERVGKALEDVRDGLDHRLLNEVEGLTHPTLENICIWIWNRLDNRIPGLAEIQVSRESCGEGCIYQGPGRQRIAAE